MNKDTGNTTKGQCKTANWALQSCKYLIEFGAAMHPLAPRQKKPIADDWSQLERASYESLSANWPDNGNIGLRLGEPSKTALGYWYVIDLDVRKPEKAAEAHAELDRLAPNWRALPSVISGSGGESRHLHFFSKEVLRSKKLTKSPGTEMVWDDRKQRDVKKHDWEIEFFGTGKQVVAPPSIHPDTGKSYRWERPLDLGLWALVDGLAPTVDVSGWPLREFAAEVAERPAPTPASWARISPIMADALHLLTESGEYDLDDRDHWWKVGMIYYHESGGSDEGFVAWCDWSRDSTKFDLKDQKRVWKSFGGEKKRPLSAGTLFSDAAQLGFTGHQHRAVTVLDSDFEALPRQQVALKLLFTQKGALQACVSNAALTLQKAARINHWTIRRNEFSGLEEWNGEQVTDHHLDFIQGGIEQAGMPNVGKERTFQAVRMEGSRCLYHPVRDYLETLHHDGVPRLDTWLTRYAKAVDAPYVRAVGRAFLIAMVARVMQPGCKMDTALVLRGAQGLRKSTACSILGGEWYGENQPAIVSGNKDADQYPPGHWLIELAENAPTKKADQDYLKAFITRATDELRLPFGRTFSSFPRQSVFVVTTNQHEFLRDDTGGRRWWPVTVESVIDTDALASDRDQLFAEAVAAYRSGDAWHLSPEMEREAAVVQDDARETDPWDDLIQAYLDGTEYEGKRRETVRMIDVLTHALGIPSKDQDRKTQTRAAGIMKRLGWTRGRTNSQRHWKRKCATIND